MWDVLLHGCRIRAAGVFFLCVMEVGVRPFEEGEFDVSAGSRLIF